MSVQGDYKSEDPLSNPRFLDDNKLSVFHFMGSISDLEALADQYPEFRTLGNLLNQDYPPPVAYFLLMQRHISKLIEHQTPFEIIAEPSDFREFLDLVKDFPILISYACFILERRPFLFAGAALPVLESLPDEERSETTFIDMAIQLACTPGASPSFTSPLLRAFPAFQDVSCFPSISKNQQPFLLIALYHAYPDLYTINYVYDYFFHFFNEFQPQFVASLLHDLPPFNHPIIVQFQKSLGLLNRYSDRVLIYQFLLHSMPDFSVDNIRKSDLHKLSISFLKRVIILPHHLEEIATDANALLFAHSDDSEFIEMHSDYFVWIVGLLKRVTDEPLAALRDNILDDLADAGILLVAEEEEEEEEEQSDEAPAEHLSEEEQAEDEF